MTVKIQCPCGAKYSFEVEPVDGRMPYAVNCPVCQMDGTEAANQILAADRPKLRIHNEPPSHSAAEAAAPIVRAPVRALDQIAEERKQVRNVGLIVLGVCVFLLGLFGVWMWYLFAGSKPHDESTLTLSPGGGWHASFFAPEKILLVSPLQAIVHDLATGKNLWSTSFSSPGEVSPDTGPQTYIDNDSIWICLGAQLVRLNRASGAIEKTIPINGELQNFTPEQTNLLVVSAPNETTREVLQVDPATGETASREITVPRSQKHEMPDELPPNVQPTAGVLLAQANGEQKFNKPLDAVSSEFFSAGVNLVEMRVTLLEPKVNWVQAIKPRGESQLNGNTSTSTSVGAVEEEVFNDIKRSNTGGVKGIDVSTYHVRLRRWVGAQPVEWQGDVVGVPMFFSLPTVDLLVAGQTITVFDKQNNELFAAKLAYSLGAAFSPDKWDHHSVPAVETNSTLYFFDAGVLTAFSLPSGDIRWRLTSIGIHRLQIDGQGNLYVDTTTASPEDIQYSEQINLEGAAPVLLKVAADSGKILWQVEKHGQACFLSGKYVYTISEQSGGGTLFTGLAEAVNAPRPEGPSYFHAYRINPDDGKVMWDFYREELPGDVSFFGNRFLLRFGSKVETWKFLSF